MSKLSVKQINNICQQTIKLCHKKQFDNAKKCWQKLKSGGKYYKFVIPDFAFHNIKAIDQDISLTKPFIIKTIYHKPIKVIGMMAHAGRRKSHKSKNR